MNKLGREIKRRRIAKGLGQDNLAYEMGEIVVGGVTTRTISRWENGHSTPQPKHIPGLMEVLDFSKSEIDRYFGVSSGSSDVYQVNKFTEFFDASNRLTKLEDELDRIEYIEFPVPDVPGNDYGGKSWGGVYEACHETGCVVSSSDGETAGYWWFVPISPQILEKGMKGENINANFNVEYLNEFGPPGGYDVYFVSLFIRKKFGNPAVLQHLLFGLQDTLVGLAEQDIFIRRVFGNMSSPRMITLARNMGFREVCDHKHHVMEDVDGKPVPTKIFEANLFEESGMRMIQHTPRLVELYKEAQRNGYDKIKQPT